MTSFMGVALATTTPERTASLMREYPEHHRNELRLGGLAPANDQRDRRVVAASRHSGHGTAARPASNLGPELSDAPEPIRSFRTLPSEMRK